jgi:hypothetical protein
MKLSVAQTVKAVGWVRTALTLSTSAAGGGWPALLHESATLQKWIVIGSISGCLLGYVLAIAFFDGVAIRKRRWVAGASLLMALCSAGLAVGVLASFDPDIAKMADWIAAIHNLFMNSDILAPAVCGFLAAATAFFLTCVVIVPCRGLDRTARSLRPHPTLPLDES